MAPVWRYLSFTQNIGLHYGETFTHSWSLCIEEQFYLLLPLAVLALLRPARSPRLLWCALVAAIGAGIATRWINFLHGEEAFSAPAYYSTLCRFDELLPGVASDAEEFSFGLFTRILRHGNALLTAGLTMVLSVLYCVLHEAPTAFLASTFGFSLVAIGFGLLTCAALSPRSLMNRLRIPGCDQPGVVVVRGLPGAQAGVHGTKAATGQPWHRSGGAADRRVGDGGGGVRRLVAVPAGRDAIHAVAGALVSNRRIQDPCPRLPCQRHRLSFKLKELWLPGDELNTGRVVAVHRRQLHVGLRLTLEAGKESVQPFQCVVTNDGAVIRWKDAVLAELFSKWPARRN
jgi:hypothetical protein